MFDKDRYLTSGVQNTVPLPIQLILWKMIDDARLQTELDYLQVFELKEITVEDMPMQEVVHFQEQPEYRTRLTFPFAEPINTKLYIIDDGEYSTMLLPSER